MTPCREIQARAAYLAALPEADPERKLAVEHARTCPACAAALAEGERVIATIDRMTLPPPSDLALKRASEAILRELGERPGLLARLWRSGRTALIGALPIVGAWAVAVALAKHRAGDRASWLWSTTVALCASILASAGLEALGAGAAVALSGIFSGLIGSGGMLSPAIGVKCVLIELIAASLPLGTTAFLVIAGRAPSSPWRFSAAAALGAFAGHAGLHLTCPVHTASPHLFAFHTGGVILAAMVGLAVSRFPAVRPSR